MGINSYISNPSRRIFVNNPFKGGMMYKDLMEGENIAKAIVNFDSPSTGDKGYPRPGFVNAVISNGYGNLKLPKNLIKQTTNIGKTFIIGSDFEIEEDAYINEAIGDAASGIDVSLTSEYGLQIIQLNSTLEEYASKEGAQRVVFVSNVDGDTITVYNYGDEPTNTYDVRLLGVDTPELGEDYASTAQTLTYNTLVNAEVIYLLFDPASAELDEYDRKLAYVMTATNEMLHYTSLGNTLLLQGLAHLSYAGSDFIQYEDMYLLYKHAISKGFNLHNDVSYGATAEEVAMIEEHNDYLNIHEVEEPDVDNFFRKIVKDTNTISSEIYDSESYFEEPKTAADLNLSGEDVVVQFLVHYYEKQEYTHVTKNKEIPHVNMPWRNAVGVLGRIVENGIVRYKGLIIIQYDGTEHNIIVQKATEVSLAAFNNEDVTSIQYNALDNDPYVFEDAYGTDASAFVTPIVAGVYMYDKNIRLNDKAKVVKSVNAMQQCFVKPYVVIPNITDANHAFTRIRIFTDYEMQSKLEITDNEEWTEVLGSGTHDATAIEAAFNAYFDSLDKVWNFSQNDNEPIRVELEQKFNNLSKAVVSEAGTASTYVLDVSTQADSDLEIIDESYSIKTTHTTYPSLLGGYVERVSFKITNLDTSETTTKSFIADGVSGNNIIFIDQDEFKIEFEDLLFTFTQNGATKISTDSVIDILYTGVLYKSIGTSITIIKTGFETIDSQDLISQHNVWNATHLALYDRFIIYYGEHMGNNSIQFSNWDQPEFAPFPFGQIMFDSEIVHVHTHQGNIFIFAEDGIHMLHSGLDYLTLSKTFVYAGVSLHPAERNTVISSGTEIFFISNSKGYVIRANQYVESSNDVYVMPITTAVNGILETPINYIKSRMQNGYTILVDNFDDLTVQYSTIVVNEDLYIIASYHMEDPIDNMMVSYIYNRDTKKWKVYDTIVGSFPSVFIRSSNIKRFDMICMNHPTDGYPTYATYKYTLPDNSKGYTIGDARSMVRQNGVWQLADEDTEVTNALIPVQCFLDSGALALSPQHNKKVRKIIQDFVNTDGKEVTFNVIPYADGVMIKENLSIEALLDDYGDIINDVSSTAEVIVPEIKKFISPSVTVQEGFTVTESAFTTRASLRLKVSINMRARLPGFQLYLPATERLDLFKYAIVYRQISAR